MTGDCDFTAQIVDQVCRAAQSRTPLRIVGGDSKAALGCRFDGEPLTLAGHSGIVDYEPNELVMTARTGTRLTQIHSALAEHGQVPGFEPPRIGPAATIGGTLACNLSGPGRPWLGSVRDAVLGMTLVNGRGQLLRFGGRVIKNVAGFDASRLQAGAWGALGVMTELSFTVLPRPQATVTLAHELDARAAVRRMNELAASAAPVTGAAWLAGRQYIRLAGSEDAVAAAAAQLGGEATDDAIWQRLRDRSPDVFADAGAGALWRLSVRPTASTLLDEHGVIVDWGGAVRYLRSTSTLEQMSRLASGAGGYAMRLDGNSDGTEFMQSPAPGIRRLHERLKLAFDPKRIFNPGRLYGWL